MDEKILNVLTLCVNVNNTRNFEYYVDELNNLVTACNMNHVTTLTQNLQKKDPRSYVGRGKLEELIELIEYHEIDLVIAMEELSGRQSKLLEKETNVMVIDRTELILEIFKTRAQTKEAKLQVQIAKLKYELPRMKGTYENLSRQRGSSGGGISRGSGETKLELDKRKIQEQIIKYELELDKFVANRALIRQNRDTNLMKSVALVGYTNAGKSTIMNALVDEEKSVFEKDMLFATLDTSTRNIKLQNNHQFLLVDTVGFVSNLPHELVKAFRSTLEEVCNADLILHVCDISNPDMNIHMQVVKDTLETLGANDIDSINVYNKMDISIPELLENVSTDLDDNLLISARKKQNLDELLSKVDSIIFNDSENFKLFLSYSKMNMLDTFHKNHLLENIEYVADGVTFDVELTRENTKLYEEYIQLK